MPIADRMERRAYQRAWLAKRRGEALVGASCVECGSVDGLELDHIDPTTKVDHKIWSWSKKRRDAELKKCQWLCGPCHRAKTTVDHRELRAAEPLRIRHGQTSGYRRGCRCPLCSDAKRQSYRREQRSEKLTRTTA